MRVLMPEPGAAFTDLARALAERFNALPASTRTGEIHLQTRRLDGELVLQGAGEDWHLPYTHWHEDLGRLPHRRLQMWCTALVEALIPRLDAERWGREPLRFRWLRYSVGDSASLVLARHGIVLEGPLKSTSVRSQRMGGGTLCMGADALAFIADNPGTPPQHYPHADIVSAHVDDIGIYGFTLTLALRRGRARFNIDDHDDNKHHVAYFAEHLPDIAKLFDDRDWEGIIGHAETILARDHLHEHMALSGAYVETQNYPESAAVAEVYLARHPEQRLRALARMHWVCAVWHVIEQDEKAIDTFLAVDEQLPDPPTLAQQQLLTNMMSALILAGHDVLRRVAAHYSPASPLRMQHHNFACLFANLDEHSNALAALERAIEQGETWEMIEEDDDLAALFEDAGEARRLKARVEEIAGREERPNHEYIQAHWYGPDDVPDIIELHRETPAVNDGLIDQLGRIGTPTAIDYLKELAADPDTERDSRSNALLSLLGQGEDALTAFARAQWSQDDDADSFLWMELRGMIGWVKDIGRFKRDLAEGFGIEGELAAEHLEPRERDRQALSRAIATGHLQAVKDYLDVWGDLNTQHPDVHLYAQHFALEEAAQAVMRQNDKAHRAVLEALVSAAHPIIQAMALIQTASEATRIEELRILLQTGVAPDVSTQGGETALARALNNANTKAAYWLLKHGADPKPHYHPEHPYGKGGEDLIDRLLESALAGRLQTPRALLPDNAELETTLRRWLAGLTELGRAHPNEQFYVLGTDEDELRANTEQAFAATLAEHIARHDERKPTDLDAETVGAALDWEGEDLDDLFELAAELDYGDFDDLDELAEAVNASHTRENEEKDRHGNPYRDDPDTLHRLRYDIDTWSYSIDDTQIDQTQALDLSPLQEIREDDARNYAELMRDLLLANRQAIATRLPLTRDFTIIASDQPVTPRSKIPA